MGFLDCVRLQEVAADVLWTKKFKIAAEKKNIFN
jgi:hypothetical protein